MDARAIIVEALDQREAAAEALATAEAVYAVAVKQAENAGQRVADIAAIEEQAVGDFADRIRAAVATGAKLTPAKPSADAIARHTAEAESRAATAAVTLLAVELEQARKALEGAQLGVQLAEHDACAAAAAEIVERMRAALQTMIECRLNLDALIDVAITPLPGPTEPLRPGQEWIGAKRIVLDAAGQALVRIDLGPQLYRNGATSGTRDAVRNQWRAWRNALPENPDTPTPWYRHD